MSLGESPSETPGWLALTWFLVCLSSVCLFFTLTVSYVKYFLGGERD